MVYVIENTCGMPQCGFERIICSAWCEVEEYFAECDHMDDLENGYAIIRELSSVEADKLQIGYIGC